MRKANIENEIGIDYPTHKRTLLEGVIHQIMEYVIVFPQCHTTVKYIH